MTSGSKELNQPSQVSHALNEKKKDWGLEPTELAVEFSFAPYILYVDSGLKVYLRANINRDTC